MKRIAVVILLLVAGCARADMMTSNGASYVRLTGEACATPGILAQLSEQMRSVMRQASVGLRGAEPLPACWVLSDGVVHLLYEDGDLGHIPVALFRQVPQT